MKYQRVEKPWGYFETFALNEKCTVKIITVNPGQRLSLQSHEKRDELWIALDDGLVAIVGEREIELKKGERVFIRRGEKHRLICAGDKPARVLEISFGEFDENDIVRYEDDYGRV